MVSTSGGRLDCAEIVIQTLATNEPKVILPCNGDRVFGMAQHNEMAFAFPWAYAREITEGLEGTQQRAARVTRSPSLPSRTRMVAALAAAA